MIPAQSPTHCDCEIHCRFYPSYDEEHNNPCPFFGKCTSTNDTRRQPQQPDALFEIAIDKLKRDEYVREVAYQISKYVGTNTKITFSSIREREQHGE